MQKVAILGMGLIGGSLGLKLNHTQPDLSVVGYDPDRTAASVALTRGAVGEVADDPSKCVAGADLVVLAMHVDRIPEMLDAVAGHLGPDAVVTDVGSSKAGVVAAGEAVIGGRFVGGHPMAGSERHGIEAATAELFEDAWWILTPTDATSSSAYREVAALVTSVGAKVVALAPEVHDSLIARLSHVPQLLASAVVDMAASWTDQEALLGLAANGFRDVTRIAASDPGMWLGVIRANREAVLEGLESLGSTLDGVAKMVTDQRWEELEGFLGRARSARLELFAKAAYTGEPVALMMLIPDRPGVLAEVTTAAGELGANIEDIQIFHSTEGGRGRLELVVAGRSAAADLSARLEELGYHVDQGVPE